MDYNEENMVVDEATEAAMDELLTDDESDEAEESDESLDSLMGNEGEEESAEEQEPEQKGTAEPGYVQKRIDKALARERANIIAEVKAEMEAQYAPIRERLLVEDAKEMVRRGEVKDIETAKELLRYRQGNPQPKAADPEHTRQPRNDRGQFAPANQFDSETSSRIDMLADQADVIKAMTGIDVIEVFSNDEEIRNKVVSGEMDFVELAKQLQEQQKEPPKKHPPAPMRSPNGANGQFKGTIMSMTDAQFEMLEQRVKEGVRFRE